MFIDIYWYKNWYTSFYKLKEDCMYQSFSDCNEFSNDIRVNVNLISELTTPQITSRLI